MFFKKLAITQPKFFKKIFDFLDLLLMDNKRCSVKLQKVSTNNALSQYLVKSEFHLHEHCFISYINFIRYRWKNQQRIKQLIKHKYN